ncbi:RES domain-containing protein [Vibrio tasmaniensis]|nr:RES domain-containing protein [Vibrio tasmaniensis]TKG39633.1 RES domain-containing protein [Vibrio tasmaniensis]TKG40727.1 RES domain-containing protein [Vibrio tasmaniensis]TKG49963.1 RES domain-containing protein [Vibrio tasmaniensis]TKG50840.1 RES domain-containing protein [Vibrio tasmaniensis]
MLLCSNCFEDEGLKINAYKVGNQSPDKCPNCNSIDGNKLTKELIEQLAWRFFVSGTTKRCDYGAAPVIQMNEYHYGKSDISPSPWLKNDIKLIEDTAKIGFFHYGPRLWMVGEVEPLKDLQNENTRDLIIQRVITEYPEKIIPSATKFYRLRVNPTRPSEPMEYDSPPIEFSGKGRLDSSDLSIMYGSQDIDVCIHECRASADDDIYVATLKTKKNLRLLDLTHVLVEDRTEFENLDLAIHMLFLAKSHSYEISRAIVKAAEKVGYDGVIYPSFFSLIRTGGHPFDTVYGLSLRRHHPERQQYADTQTIENLGLFGSPLQSNFVEVVSINRLVITHVAYQGHFGPVEY